MTVQDLYYQLEDLVKNGHGDKKIGWFNHQDANFIEGGGVEITKDGGYYQRPDRAPKTEEVVQIWPEYKG